MHTRCFPFLPLAHFFLQARVELDRSERLAGLASELQQQLAANGGRQGQSSATSGLVGRTGGSLPTSPRCVLSPLSSLLLLSFQEPHVAGHYQRSPTLTIVHTQTTAPCMHLPPPAQEPLMAGHPAAACRAAGAPGRRP